MERRGRLVNSKRELSIDVVHEQLISTIYEQSILPVDKTMAEDLIVSCSTEANNSVADECQMNPDVKKRTFMSEGRDRLCHVTRLPFYLNISFYLMQYTPLWRSKFRTLRITKTRTKIGTLRIPHTSSKLYQDIRSGSFTETNLWKIGSITDKVW